jgi:splicing factor 3B subunit 3
MLISKKYIFYINFSAKLVNLISKEIFGQIRKIMPFRLTGNKKDFIIVGSDSGRIVILEVNLEKREFVKIHQETFGKTGCRRVVPGEFIACDPKGRAIMISAIEKQKFVYITGRDSENKMTISSPLEAHKSNTICFELAGLDVSYENPLFACLEVEYGDSENENSSINTGESQKILVYYEMDLGLNHVVRKNYEKVDNSAHLIIPVPGSTEGPGGLLLFCENFVIYKKTNHEDRLTYYPMRYEYKNTRGVMIVASSTYKRKDMFFVLVQTELGDIFKLSLEYTGEDVHGVMLQYFDTIPLSISLCVLLSGYLFSASETSNQ